MPSTSQQEKTIYGLTKDQIYRINALFKSKSPTAAEFRNRLLKIYEVGLSKGASNRLLAVYTIDLLEKYINKELEEEESLDILDEIDQMHGGGGFL